MTRSLRIEPVYVHSWACALALRMLAGRCVLVSYDLIVQGRVKIHHLLALVAAGCELVFDSGAFQAWKLGRPMDAPAYVAFLRGLAERGITWRWAVATDVIGDAEGTRRNWRALLREAPDLAPKMVPVFHEGDPWDLLEEYEPESRLVGLGRTKGRNSKRATLEWYDACFNRHPAMRPHALGNASPDTVPLYQFRSFDASTWERDAAYSNALGFPYGRVSKETRMRAYIEAFDTFEYRPAKQLSLCLTGEE